MSVVEKIEKSGEKTIRKRELKPGDIIAVSRKLPYQHFGVYIGDGRVIHFAALNGDWEGTPVIHEAPFENFLRDAKEFEILEFGEKRGETKRCTGLQTMGSAFVNFMVQRTGISLFSLVELFRNLEYHLYSPEETIMRAKMVAEQCAGEGSVIKTILNGHAYNLLFNNCEHFAIWCKTGVHESKQVDRIVKCFVEALYGERCEK